MAKRKVQDGLRPWDRRRGEGADAHKACCAYLEMGEDRTIDKVTEALGIPVGQASKWSRRWGWVDRAIDFDSHVASVEQSAKDDVIAERARTWEKRKQKHAEETYQLAKKLRDRVERMLGFPLARKVKKRDGTTTIIKPARWNFGNVATIARLIAELEQLAIETALPSDKDTEEPQLTVDVDVALSMIYRDEEGPSEDPSEDPSE